MSKEHPAKVVEEKPVVAEDSPSVVSSVLDVFHEVASTFEDPEIVKKGEDKLDLLVKGTSLDEPPVRTSIQKLFDALGKLHAAHVDHEKKMVVVAQAVHANQALNKIVPPQPV